MADGKISIQSTDNKIYTITSEVGAAGAVALTLPKEGGMLAIDAKVVHKTDDETIDGVKTFTSSPVVPTPMDDSDAVNKEYADLKVALTDFTGTNVSLSYNGYQKLPSGLIIQWGAVVINSNPTTWTFPIAFPNKCVAISGMTLWEDGMSYANLSTNPHLSTTSIQFKNSTPGTACFAMALGY